MIFVHGLHWHSPGYDISKIGRATGPIGLINLALKSKGECSAGNSHIAFDVAGVGNAEWFDDAGEGKACSLL
ncbi:MAG: hypothetical protein WCG31_05755 [Deltaproteobacteria bacterium]